MSKGAKLIGEMRLSEIPDTSLLEERVTSGIYSDQDVIDLYHDYKMVLEELSILKGRKRKHSFYKKKTQSMI